MTETAEKTYTVQSCPAGGFWLRCSDGTRSAIRFDEEEARVWVRGLNRGHNGTPPEMKPDSVCDWVDGETGKRIRELSADEQELERMRLDALAGVPQSGGRLNGKFDGIPMIVDRTIDHDRQLRRELVLSRPGATLAELQAVVDWVQTGKVG